MIKLSINNLMNNFVMKQVVICERIGLFRLAFREITKSLLSLTVQLFTSASLQFSLLLLIVNVRIQSILTLKIE